MADAAKTNTPTVPAPADGDRVAMLSISKDGTPDQHDPAIIGDKDFALEATKRQFAENAVSKADDAQRRADDADAAAAEKVDQDPGIAERQKAHEKVQADAEKQAAKVVESLGE